MSSYHTWAHINKVVREKDFSVSVHNVTEQIGILSVQGPNRYSNEMRIRIYVQIMTKMYDIIYLTLFIQYIFIRYCSRQVLQILVEDDLSNKSFPYSISKLVRINGELVHMFRLSFVGELGFELHIPRSSCEKVYKALMECSKKYDMKLAGYRALYSLSCEKGTQQFNIFVSFKSICCVGIMY